MSPRATGLAPHPWRHQLAALWLVLVSAVAMAQPQPTPVKRAPIESTGPAWQALSAQQRATLAPLQNDWASIDAPRKSKWLELAGRYPKLPPGEQERVQTRMTEWARMTPNERARARLNFQEAKRLPNQDRQDQWQAYQALSDSERQALASRGTASRQQTAPLRAKPPPELAAKRNIVPNASLSGGPTRPVAPTVVQASPGATTTLVTRQPAPPAHQQAGLPKIAATPGFVDGQTLLPKRGPQVAGVRSAASAPASRP